MHVHAVNKLPLVKVDFENNEDFRKLQYKLNVHPVDLSGFPRTFTLSVFFPFHKGICSVTQLRATKVTKPCRANVEDI
jgi:hypothetical protein